MARHLHQRGILTKLRQSAGQDVDGGCGQLRARLLSTAGATGASVTPTATIAENGVEPAKSG
jgi:23S rRNA (adenine2503-C2)-methyltransferase